VARLSPLLLAQAAWRLKPPLRALYDPEDLVNDAWAVALPRLGELEAHGGRHTPTLLKFLATTMLFRVNNLMRKHLRGEPLPRPHRGTPGDSTETLARLPDERSGVVTAAVRAETRNMVLACMGELDPRDREVLLLRGIEQQSNQAAALLLGLSPETVKKRYQRALERLRARLPGSIFEELEAD
jgi:RNA polymerase sigma factor (sigma-70 family)